MAIPIEGTTIVVKQKLIEPLLNNGSITPPTPRCISDDSLWCCSFMDEKDAAHFLQILRNNGLNVDNGPDSDGVILNEYDQEIKPYCEWLNTGKWEKAVIAWMAGEEPKTVTAFAGWDPNKGSSLERISLEDIKRDYIEEESKDGVTCYVHKETGERRYVGRAAASPQLRFDNAVKVLSKYLFGEQANHCDVSNQPDLITAEKELGTLVSEDPNWWNAWLFLGKAHQLRGQKEPAYTALKKAVETSNNHPLCLKELGGILLEVERHDEAVQVTMQLVMDDPKNFEYLSNHAIALLLANKIPEAEKTIKAALAIAPSDPINKNVEGLIREISLGLRPLPRNLAEAMQTRSKKTWVSSSSSLPNNSKDNVMPWWKRIFGKKSNKF